MDWICAWPPASAWRWWGHPDAAKARSPEQLCNSCPREVAVRVAWRSTAGIRAAWQSPIYVHCVESRLALSSRTQ